MIEPEWMKFESTGSVSDYLKFKGHMVDAVTSSVREQEETGRSEMEYGTDHSADGHGIICSPGG